MEQINEEWRDIEGYEGLYQVSNFGRVRSFDRIDRLGRLKPGGILKPGTTNGGYLRVVLCKEGKVKTFLIHRLVGQTFIPNPEGLPIINHRDENPKNNQADNLEWCTQKYNCNYGTRNERVLKNMVQTNIRNGRYDPEMCGIRTKDRNEYARMWYKKNRERILEYQREWNQKNRDHIRELKREYQREWRRRKKQEKKKDNSPSELSLW